MLRRFLFLRWFALIAALCMAVQPAVATLHMALAGPGEDICSVSSKRNGEATTLGAQHGAHSCCVLGDTPVPRLATELPARSGYFGFHLVVTPRATSSAASRWVHLPSRAPPAQSLA